MILRMVFPKSWLEPHREHVDCAEKTSLCQEATSVELHRVSQEEWLKFNQKLVDGYQKHLTEV